MTEKKHKKIIKIFIFILFFLSSFVWQLHFSKASDSVGGIDSVYKFAKGIDANNVKINFGLFKGSVNVVVTDTDVTGFAWGDNIGWVNLSPTDGGVLNNGEGMLSGLATSEFGGWINFKPTNGGVTINSSGEFMGYALSEKFGRISFNCANDNSCNTDNYKVKTDWRPISTRAKATVPPTATVIIPTVIPTTPSVVIENKNTKTGTNTDTTTLHPKPLPIVDVGQYAGGDVIIKNNPKNIDTKGEIKNILPSDNVPTAITDSNVPVQNINSNNVALNLVQKTKEISSFIKKQTVEIKKEAVIITQTPAVDISTKTVTTVGVAGGGTAIFSSFAGTAISFSEFILNFFRFWSILLSAIGLRKKRKPWGTVYDSVTKQPLDPAYVVLQDKENHEIATAITDFDGRFGFLVSEGAYKIYVRKNNYSFPSRKLFGTKNDELYDNLYFGEFLDLKQDKLIIKNIPMDPEKFDWNEFTKKDKKLLKFNSPYAHALARISNVLFYFGFILALLLLVINIYNYYNIAIVVLYLIFSFLRKIGIKQKSFGIISENLTNIPLSFAIVRIFSKKEKKEIFHRITDKYGRYYCLLPKGEYYITIEKKNNDESYSKVYTSDPFYVKSGILNKDYKL